MTLPPPKIELIEGIYVVRDDLIPGGTKQRALEQVLPTFGPGEYVYAGPVSGYAGLALAYACRALGLDYRATLFQAQRRVKHRRSLEALSVGATIKEIDPGYLSNVTAKARRYCAHTGAVLCPWGLDYPAFLDALTAIAKTLPIEPTEVWTVAGSGVLSRALQRAWPTAAFYAVNISQHRVNAGKATILNAPESFEREAVYPPPFPSCSTYDAKAWRFVYSYAKPGALFWNVAS